MLHLVSLRARQIVFFSPHLYRVVPSLRLLTALSPSNSLSPLFHPDSTCVVRIVSFLASHFGEMAVIRPDETNAFVNAGRLRGSKLLQADFWPTIGIVHSTSRISPAIACKDVPTGLHRRSRVPAISAESFCSSLLQKNRWIKKGLIRIGS